MCVYFSVPKSVCLSSSGQCADLLPVFHETFKRKMRKKAPGKHIEQSGKKFFKQSRRR